MERLIDFALCSAFNYLDKGAEAVRGCQLPGFVCRIELQDRVFFIFCPEADYSLGAINVKNPHRYAVFSGDPREEIGEGLGIVVVFDYEFTRGV